MTEKKMAAFAALLLAVACDGAGEPLGHNPYSQGDSGLDAGPMGCREGMVEIPGFDLCMDATEYTNARFAEFLNARGANDCEGFECRVMGQTSMHGGCWSWLELEAIVEVEEGVFEANDKVTRFPVGWTTWFGAKAACEWEGKGLCPQEAHYAACSRGGTQHYPGGGTTYIGEGEDKEAYGAELDWVEDRCWVGHSSLSTVGVGWKTQCEGGYEGLFDLLGNVGEWGVGSGGDLACGGLGGSALSSTEVWPEDSEWPYNIGTSCGTTNAWCTNNPEEDAPFQNISALDGFRCCAPLPE